LQGDDKVIDEAFQGRHVERAALRNKTGKMAVSLVDQRVMYFFLGWQYNVFWQIDCLDV